MLPYEGWHAIRYHISNSSGNTELNSETEDKGQPLRLMQGEKIVDEIGQYYAPIHHKLLGLASFLIFIGALVAVIGQLAGIVLIVIAAYIIYHEMKKAIRPKYTYILTNRRAIFAGGSPKNRYIIASCNLADINPILKNVRTETSTAYSQNSRQEVSQEVGDIAFISKGTGEVLLEFAGVPGPREIVKTIETLIRSAEAG